MKLLILNGSPHADNANSNSAIFIREFQKGLKEPGEVRCVARENPVELAAYLRGFDTVLFVMPLYIHAMPGVVMKLFEQMGPVTRSESKRMGFIVQQGFVETAQSRFLLQYLEIFTKRMGYENLGFVTHGDSAGTYMMPEKATEKLRGQLNALGTCFEKTGAFNKQLVEELAQPYEIPHPLLKKLDRLNRIKIGHLLWHFMLLKNHAFAKRRDRPFAEKTTT